MGQWVSLVLIGGNDRCLIEKGRAYEVPVESGVHHAGSRHECSAG